MRGMAVFTTVSSRNASRVPTDMTPSTNQRRRSALPDRRVVNNDGSALVTVTPRSWLVSSLTDNSGSGGMIPSEMTNSEEPALEGKRDRLVRSATELLYRRGVDSPTLAEIAEEAEVPA